METKTFHRHNRDLFLAPHNFIIFMLGLCVVVALNKVHADYVALALAISLLSRAGAVLRSKVQILSMEWFTTLVIVPGFVYCVISILNLLF